MSRELWQKLNNHYPTYLVGGAVRDILLGKTPKDYDYATKATPGQIVEVFQGHKVNFVGAHFGVVIVDGFEFATFRADVGDNCRYTDTIEEDLARRDFSINAMAMSFDGILIDLHKGRRDIKYKLINFVGWAYDRIKEGPVRILRAARFTTGGLYLSQRTISSASLLSNLLDGIKPERIQLELIKSLEARWTSFFFEALKDMNSLCTVFPDLERCWKHDGGNFHLEDVFQHLMLTGDAISPKYPMVKLAGYLHDIGKPAAYNPDDRSFICHHDLEAEINQKLLTYLKFSNEWINAVVGLTKLHMHTVIKGSSPKSIRKLVAKLATYNLTWEDFLRLRIADHRANLNKDPYTISEIKEMIRAFQQEEKVTLSTHSLAISGGELIHLLFLEPGPIVGRLQKDLLQYVIEEGEEVNNTLDLLTKAKELLYA